MTLLLDTHLLLWFVYEASRISGDCRALMADPSNQLAFSVVSVWEIAIKYGLGKPDFRFDPALTRKLWLEAGCIEVPINADHAITVSSLPLHHRDPFDRLLLAQAITERMTLVTADPYLGLYEGPIELI